jgi:hypothetical protein
MKICFVTTCKNRVPHLALTLSQNLYDNLGPDIKFVVLDYNDQNGLGDLRSNHAQDIASGRLVVYQYRKNVPFRMAHAKNMAHRLGAKEGADILVNLDADNFTGPGFAQYLLNEFQAKANIFMWALMVKGTDMPRGISGRIAVRTGDFFLAGGYDEKYETHSPDDKDFNARLRRLGIEGREIDRRFLLAINHNDKMRYREYPEADPSLYDDDSPGRIDQHSTVVNAGKIGCGTVWRNFQADPMTIWPVPSRIFGVGLHKTATTSLHTALQILGYKSGHWHTAHWAKAIWHEMNSTGRSPTIEKCHAVCDLPIPLLFRKLDAAYPGSKFILTVRDEWSWLTGVRKHWSTLNKFRGQWDGDCFTHRIHKVLYGQSTFDPTVFLERYRAHNAEVREYFRDRPRDLLVMDMDDGCGWTELCAFLNVAVPAQPYPTISPCTPDNQSTVNYLI